MNVLACHAPLRAFVSADTVRPISADGGNKSEQLGPNAAREISVQSEDFKAERASVTNLAQAIDKAVPH